MLRKEEEARGFLLPRIRHRKPRRTFTFVINVDGFAQRGDDSYALLSRVSSATEEALEKRRRETGKNSKRDSDNLRSYSTDLGRSPPFHQCRDNRGSEPVRRVISYYVSSAQLL